MDGTDADGEWSDDDGVKSGSVTALSDNEPDDIPTSLKITTTITTSPGNHKIDPVHAILDKIDAELGAIATANNITTFSQPQSVKISPFPTVDRFRLEAQGVVFDTTDELNQRDKLVLGHTRGGSSDRDTGVGTGSVQDDAGSEHKRIVGSAQVYSDVGNLTDVHTDGRRGAKLAAPLEDDHRGEDGHSDLDSLAAQQIDEKFKEIMRKKRGGYLDDLKARIPRPGSDRDTVNSEEGVVTRPTGPQYPMRHRRSHSSEPRGKPPLPTLPRTCLTPPSSPRRGPADLPPHPNHVSVLSRPPKLKHHLPRPYTGYASDLESVKTEDFESRFQDLMIGQTSKNTSSKLKTLSKKLANRESRETQVQSNMNHSGGFSYPKPTEESKSFPSARLFSSFQNKPANDLTLRKSPYSSLPAPDSRSTTDIIKLPRPRSVSPARLSALVNDGHSSKPKNGGLFSWDDAFWRGKTFCTRPDSSSSTFEEVESLCLSKSSSSAESVNEKRLSLSSAVTSSFTRQSSITSNSTGTSSGHLADRDCSSSENRSRAASSVGSLVDDFDRFDSPHRLSDNNYMDRIFQRVLEWNVGETSSDSMKFRNVGAIKTRSASSGLLDLRVTADKKARQKVLIIPDEEEGDIPFAKLKFSHKPDFQEIAEISSLKEMYPVGQSVKLRPHLNGDSSGKSNRSFSISTSSLSTDVSSWQESNKRDAFQRRNTSNFTDSNHNCTSENNPPSFPPAQPLDYYPPFNPFLPVNAERILINLGFSGSDCLLPERFLKDWYQKMAKAQKEWGQSQQFSDCQESVDENSLPSMGTSGRTTPNQVCLYPEHFPMNCLPGKSLQRSATVSSYQYPEGLDISTKMHCKEQKRFGASGEFGSSKRRRQWANTRQKSLPLFLETLNEEDESRSRRTSIDQFSQFKAFLKEEMMSVKSGGSSQDNNIDSDSDSSISAALINFSKSVSEIPEAGKQDDNKCLPSISISTKSEVDQKEKKVAHEHISHETLPSTDSLEVADIMQYQQNKNNGAGPLEPAMVSIVLEDVDGNVTDSMCNSTSFLSVDNLHIPLSGSSSTSPILSPVTVIEVGGLDNQMDSLDTDESTSVSKETDSLASNKGSFDSDRSKSESRPDDCKVRKVILEGKVIGHQSCSFPNPALKDITKERSEASASQCSFVQVDDGRLSPIVTFPSVQVLQECFDGTTDYYIAQDRSVQCEMEAGMFQSLDEEDRQDVHSVHLQVTQAEQYTQTDPEQLFSKSLSDKSSQISTQTVSCSVQTTIDTVEDDDEDCQWLLQKVLASTMICRNKCGQKHDADKTVTTTPPLMALDHILVPPRDRRHSITDDWVISNFRAQSQSEEMSINLETDISERKDGADEENKPTVYPEVPVESEFTSDSTDGKTGSQCNDQKELMLNEDGSPMTKLDIFANEFLTGAEEKCSQLRLASDTSFPDSERRHSLLSSTLSNDSWGTQNTVIYMPKPHRALLSVCNDSEVGDIDSGQTITHKNHNGDVESPFSTNLETFQKINTDKKNCEPYLRSSSDSLSLSVDKDDDVGSSAISSSMSVQSDWEIDDISGLDSASEADSDGILPKIVMDSKETVYIMHGEMEMELIDRCIDSCTIVKNKEFLHEKKHCEPQFGVFGLDGIGETELNVALEENDFGFNNRFEQVSLESGNIPKDVKDVDRNDSDSSLSQNSGLCQGEVLSGSNDCENGRGRKAMTVQKADAKKKFLSQFFINTYTQNLSENVSERRPPTVEKNYSKQNTYWKSSSGSHLGLSQVKQMTTIYESDHSESESGDGCRALRGSRHPDIKKSCTWSGSHLPKFLPPGSRSLTDGTGENSMEQGFAQLARKAFISQKAERVTSPCESSDGEAGYGSGLSEIQDNTCNAAEPILSSFNEIRSESGVYGTLSNDSIEHSMERAEMEDSPPEQDVLQIYQATSEQEHTHMYSDQKKEARYISSKTFIFSPTVSVNAANSDSQMVSKACMAAPGGFQLNEDNSFIPIVSAISSNPQTMLTSSSLRRTVFPRQKGISSVKHGNICTAPSSNKVLMTSKIKMRLVTSLNSKSTSSTNSISPITPSSSRDDNSVETSSCSSSSKSLVTEQESLRTTTPDQVETTNSTAEDEVMVESVGPPQTEAWLYSSSGPQMNTSNNMSPDRITTRQKSVEFSFKKGFSKSEITQGDLLESSPYRNSYSSMQMSPSIDKENLAVDILNAEDNQSKFQDCKTDKPEDVSVHNMNNKHSLRSQDAEQALHYQGRSSTHVLRESEAFNSNGIPSQCLSQTNNISVRHPSLENPHGLSFNSLSTEIHSIRQEREEGKRHSVEDGLGRVLRSIEIQLKSVEGDFECKELSLIPGFKLQQGYKERQENPLVAEPPPADSDRPHKSLVAGPPLTDSDRPHKSLVAGPPLTTSDRPHKSLVAGPTLTDSDRLHKSLVAGPPLTDSNRLHKSLVTGPPLTDSNRLHKSLVAGPTLTTSDRPHKSLVTGPPLTDSDRLHKSLVTGPPLTDSDRLHKSLVTGPPLTDSDRLHKSLVTGPPLTDSDRLQKSLVTGPPLTDSDRPHKSLVTGPPLTDSDRLHKSLVTGPPLTTSDRPHKSLVTGPPLTTSDRPHKSLVTGPPLTDSDRPHKSLVTGPPLTDSDRLHKSLVTGPPLTDSDRPHKSLVTGPPLTDSDRLHKSLVTGPTLTDSDRLHKSLVTGPPLTDSDRPHKSLVTGPPLTDSDRLHKSLVAGPPLTDSDRLHKSLVAGPPLTDCDRLHKSLVAGPPLTDSDRLHKSLVAGPPLTDSNRPHKSLVAGPPLTDSDRPHKSLVTGPTPADSNRPHMARVTGPLLADSDRLLKSRVAGPPPADSKRPHKSRVTGPLLADSDRLLKSRVAGPLLADSDRPHKSLVSGPTLTDSNRLQKSLVTGPPLTHSDRPHKSLLAGPTLTTSDRPHKSRVTGPLLTHSDRRHMARVTGPLLADSDRLHKSLVAGPPLTTSDRPHKSLVTGPPRTVSNRLHKSLVTGPPLTDSDRLHKSLVTGPPLTNSDRLHKSLVTGPPLTDSDRIQKSLVAGPPLTDSDRLHKSLVAGPPLTDSDRLHKSLVTGPPLTDSDRLHKSLVTGPPLTDSDRLHKSLVTGPPLTNSDRLHKSLVAGPPLTAFDRLTCQARQNEKEEKEVRLGPRSGKALSNGLEKRRPESAVSDIRSKFEPRDITPSHNQSCVSTPKRPVNTYIMKLASKFEYS